MAVFASFFEKHFSKNSPKATDTSPAKNTHPETARESRQQQREKFYHIVRDSMVRAGVLSGGYKFKVLSHERADAGMIVMVDLAPNYMAQSAQLREIELHMSKTAELFLGILAVRIYWRLNESLQQAAPNPLSSKRAVQVESQAFQPISPEEIAAFKRTHFEPTARTTAARPGHQPPPQQAPIDLGATQFGELV